ncbi:MULTISPECIES: hypothetical protein [Pseudomonas]|uniref:Uncharacterized protein n=1 Tax=Pseudomonas sessilinigenes TaxID=658629 RepID=A0ABX8MY76_9PSED|nr:MULTISPECIES: hypothetical protein [Pseudomonas]AZC17892.1 hypothetical protein C4K40_2503 [Pseudomonas sp. CMR5c]AZC24117.1 hypothetical protein C4K39_2443 [Pseudomonas sessilinigenes]QIH08700.1 hypothetical protein ATY02_19215 [Pseudomonas sp. BIOMIG1BAC]QXH43076.1 hypothetical protein KSS89_12930 [Pseudomonas sessilinigenes]
MSKIEVDASSGMMLTSQSLNQDLVRQLNALATEEHTSSDCWRPARPMIVESTVWILIAAILWLGTLMIVA